MKQWIMRENDADLNLMSRVLKIDIKIANILANRNIRTKNKAIMFLSSSTRLLRDPNDMKDIKKALDIISRAIKQEEKIVIYGDYDVDGVMSTVILFDTLKKLNADVDFYLPDRVKDGFGLNKNIIDKIYANKSKIILTCDNGIAAIDEIAYAKSLGLKIIIIDHHEPNTKNNRDILPVADAIIDNKQKDCPYKFKFLCAGAMAYKFSKLLLDKNNISCDKDLIIFAAIATLCDIVPLIDENRIIAKLGLELINKNQIFNPGLISLMRHNKLIGKKISSRDIGFIIGPCINACGRLKTATLAAELFLTKDINRADYLAGQICELNKKRKILTRESYDKAMLELDNYDLIKNPVIVYYDKQISESIAGIIAGRVKEYFCHPVIFFTDSNNDDIIKGSARSIEGYNIFSELQKCRDLFIKFGGHPMAAGISMRKSNLELLKQKLNTNCQLKVDDFAKKINIDDELEFKDINFDFAQKIHELEPFGNSNPEPVFITHEVFIKKINIIQDKDTIIFSLSKNQKNIKAVCFGLTDYFKEQLNTHFNTQEIKKILSGFIPDFFMDIVYTIEINEFNNNYSVQLNIKDFLINGGEQ